MLNVIKNRRSVRTFDGKGLSKSDAEAIIDFAKGSENPYGIPMEFRLLNGEDGMSSPVIVGADTYIAGKIKKVPHAEEAFGFTLEKILLFAEARGVANVWLAGTFDRKAAERAMALGDGEIVPAVSPLGYKAEKMSLRESVMRKGTKAQRRIPFDELFFDEELSPLKKEDLDGLAEAFEAVRLAPSAVNRQPWRLVYDGSSVHFYKVANRVSDGWDLHKIDLGIALCHFDTALDELDVPHSFALSDPRTGFDGEYIASYLLK